MSSNSQNTNKPQLVYDMQLTLVDVGFYGNTNNGRSFYSFNPEVVEVKTKDAFIAIGFSANTPAHFFIESFYTTDSFNQIYAEKIADDKRSITFRHRNNHKCIINMLLRIYDEQKKTIINCDPQVANRPPAN